MTLTLCKQSLLQDKLCSSSPDWKIVGVCYFPGHLWIVFEMQNEDSYQVYKFQNPVGANLAANASNASRVETLQETLPTLDPSIRPNNRRIVSMAALDEKLYEQSQLLSTVRHSTPHLGGILFVFEDNVSLFLLMIPRSL